MISYKHTYFHTGMGVANLDVHLYLISKGSLALDFYLLRLASSSSLPQPQSNEISAFKLVKNEVLLKMLRHDYDFMMALLQAQMVNAYLCIKRLERLHL